MEDSPPARPALSETYYGRAASVYDQFATMPVFQSWRHAAIDSLELQPGDTVCEFGCGTGANFPLLREAVGSSGEVIGVDLVREMLAVANRRIDRYGWDNVVVIQGDATRPPVRDVNAVLTTFLVGMLPEPDAAVREWIRCVQPGGRLALMNANRSRRLLARPFNLVCRGFVRATAPGYRMRLSSPVKELEARWHRSCEALFEGTAEHEEDSLAYGFVSLASGSVPGR